VRAKPRARLALGLGDFAGSHFDRNLSAALLAPRAARQRGKVEPFVGLDQIDRSAPAAGRVSHAKLEQRIDIAGFGVGKAAPDQELRRFLTDGTHETLPCCGDGLSGGSQTNG
jgi:hypothetical protein